VQPWVAHVALVITFTVGAAIGLALGPAGLRDRMPEPARSALGPVSADRIEQHAALEQALDAELDRLRATGVSGVAVEEYGNARRAEPAWVELRQAIDEQRRWRAARLALALAWCVGVAGVSTAVIHRRARAGRSADEAWHWARHAASLAAGFVTLLLVGYAVHP
jgi:hypothetical protein